MYERQLREQNTKGNMMKRRTRAVKTWKTGHQLWGQTTTDANSEGIAMSMSIIRISRQRRETFILTNIGEAGYERRKEGEKNKGEEGQEWKEFISKKEPRGSSSRTKFSQQSLDIMEKSKRYTGR